MSFHLYIIQYFIEFNNVIDPLGRDFAIIAIGAVWVDPFLVVKTGCVYDHDNLDVMGKGGRM